MATHYNRLADQLTDPNIKIDNQRLVAAELAQYAAQTRLTANYAVTPEVASLLEREGIATYPLATQLHSHAGEKIIENVMLNKTAQHMRTSPGPYTFIQLKRAKLQYLRRGPQHNDQIINYATTPKDYARFDILSDLDNTPIINSTAFLHDTLHFLTPLQLATLFARNNGLHTLFATVVLPVEALFHHESEHRDLYTISYHDQTKSFFYEPNGLAGASYHHPVSTLQWLAIGQIVTSNFTLTFEKLETHGAHHLFTITKRTALPPIVYNYLRSDRVILPALFYGKKSNVTYPFHADFVSRLTHYVLSVKAVAVRDIWAKIRQITPTSDVGHCNNVELLRLVNYLMVVAALHSITEDDLRARNNIFMRAFRHVTAYIRDALSFLFSGSDFENLIKYLRVVPFQYMITCKKLDVRGKPHTRWLPFDHENDDPLAPGTDDYHHEPLRGLDIVLAQYNAQQPNDVDPINHQIDDDDTPETSESEAMITDVAPTTVDNDSIINAHPTTNDNTSGYDSDVSTDEPATTITVNATVHTHPVDEIVTPEPENDDTNNETATTPAPTVPNTSPTTPKKHAQMPLSPIEADILTTLGYTDHTLQYGESGKIRAIVMNEPAHTKIPGTTSKNANTVIEAFSRAHRHAYAHTPDIDRAKLLADDLENGRIGVHFRQRKPDERKSILTSIERECKAIALIANHGAGGCGKSHTLQQLFNQSATILASTLIITPTAELREDWVRKLNTERRDTINTYERAIFDGSKSIVVFDDYGKLPAGYIDLYLRSHKSTQLAILTGDERQSRHHITDHTAHSADLTAEIDHYAQYTDYYVNATHRQPRRLANPLDVFSSHDRPATVTTTDLTPTDRPLLVPSLKTKMILTEHGKRAMTYAGCQGLTVPHVAMLLDHSTINVDETALYTALSRASESITFVNTYVNDPEFLNKLEATPYIKTMLSGVREDEQAGVDHTPPEPPRETPNPRTHIPVDNIETLMEPVIEDMLEKEDRELYTEEHGKTNVVQTNNPIINAFPHQQANDSALEKITIEKRIRTSDPIANNRRIIETRALGNLLFEAYADFMQVPRAKQRFDIDLWHRCRQKAERTYLSKSHAQIANGAKRHDPDMPAEYINLLIKSQWVKKPEKVGKAIKAGQTISCFKQETVLITTTMALYLRAKRDAHQPSNVFIMCERTPNQFSEFVKTQWSFTRDSYESDYEQYDQSQDGVFLNFELRKAAHFGIPQEIIDFYRWIKTNARSFVGTLDVMRLSGEGPTFDANTECNIAYDALRYHLDSSVAAAYAGDDLARDRVCKERASWATFEPQFKLKAKPVVTRKPRFCGWLITPHGLVKDPIQLYQSFLLGEELKKIDKIGRSYAHDFQFAYKMGDKLHEIFDETQMTNHHALVRKLHRYGYHVESSGDHLAAYHVTSDRLLAHRNPNIDVQARITESELDPKINATASLKEIKCKQPARKRNSLMSLIVGRGKST
ncbi:replicase [Sclerotinia sclerotiorum alphaflexivirus 1]|nr:replicase [Sclerotinia sclerotiorum alphaflexivirus 1]